jgi:hypothetical protein
MQSLKFAKIHPQNTIASPKMFQIWTRVRPDTGGGEAGDRNLIP